MRLNMLATVVEPDPPGLIFCEAADALNATRSNIAARRLTNALVQSSLA